MLGLTLSGATVLPMRRVVPLLALAGGFWAAPAHAADPVLVAVGDIACDPGSAEFNGGRARFRPAPGVCHQKYTSDVALGRRPRTRSCSGTCSTRTATLAKFHGLLQTRAGAGEIRSPSRSRATTSTAPAVAGIRDPTRPATSATSPTSSRQRAPTPGTPRRAGTASTCRWAARSGTSWRSTPSALRGCAAGRLGGRLRGSEQERWLRADLAADRSDCTLAYWHHPRFNSSPRGEQPLMAPIWNALYEDYADIVLAGHEHSYERLAPADGRRAGAGPRHQVLGRGHGRQEHGWLPPDTAPATDVRNNHHGVLKLTLHGPSAATRGAGTSGGSSRRESGSTFADSGSGDCVGPVLRGAARRAGGRATRSRRASPVKLSRRRFRVGRRGTLSGSACRSRPRPRSGSTASARAAAPGRDVQAQGRQGPQAREVQGADREEEAAAGALPPDDHADGQGGTRAGRSGCTSGSLSRRGGCTRLSAGVISIVPISD